MASFDVEGARKEGYSDSQIAEYLAKQSRFNLQGARREGYSDADIVAHLTGTQAKTVEKPPEQKPATIAQGALGAAKEALAGPDIMAATASGAVAPVAAGLAGIAGAVLPGPAGQGAAWAQKTGEALQYQPRTEIGKAVTGAAAYPFQKLAEAGDVAGGAAAEATGSPAVGAGVNAAVQGLPLLVGAKGAPKMARAGAELAGRAAEALTPMPEPRVAALAKKAVDLGIPLRPDQLSKNPIARMVGEALEKVPLSGSKAEQRQIGFNRSVGKLIGAEADHLTPDVFDKAMNEAGGKIGEIAAQTPIRYETLGPALEARAVELARRETADTGKIVTSYIDDLREAGKDGMIDGTKFRKINSKIDQRIRTTPDGDLRHALSELKDDLHDALEANIASPERLAELKDARKKYAIGLTIEPLVAKATTTGNISPGGLLGRVTADKAGKRRMARGRGGDLGDLAEIGKLFLKEPPSSGTMERAAAYGAIGGAGYIEPHTAAAVYGAANIYNRAGPAMVKRALSKTEAKRAENRPARERKRPAQPEPQLPLRQLLESEQANQQEPLRKAVGE